MEQLSADGAINTMAMTVSTGIYLSRPAHRSSMVRSTIAERSRGAVPSDPVVKKPWNKLAIPAFFVSMVAVAIGFFTTSTITVIGVVVLAMVLSGLSLHQIRWREERGKGFALIALVLAVIAALVTAMIIAVSGAL